MLVLFGIMVLLIAVFVLSVIYTVQKDNQEAGLMAIIGAMEPVLIILGVCCIVEHFSPSISTVDVYRGKTTLEITYKDSVAIDSVVVWKEK